MKILDFDKWYHKYGKKISSKTLKYIDKAPYFLTYDIEKYLMRDKGISSYIEIFLTEQYNIYLKNTITQYELLKIKNNKIIISNGCLTSKGIVSNNIKFDNLILNGIIELSSGIDVDGDVLQIIKIDKDNVIHCNSLTNYDILVVIKDIVVNYNEIDIKWYAKILEINTNIEFVYLDKKIQCIKHLSSFSNEYEFKIYSNTQLLGNGYTHGTDYQVIENIINLIKEDKWNIK